MNAGDGGSDGTDGAEMDALNRLERLAAKVDEDEAAAPEDPREREILGRMRDLREALREGGPARASEGFAERALARMAKAGREAQVVQFRRRRDRWIVVAQAASLAVLVGLYGTLLFATRVHDVGPRWSEGAGASDADPDAGASASATSPEGVKTVATASPLGLDCAAPPTRGGGAARWNSRCSASPMSDSSESTTKTPTC